MNGKDVIMQSFESGDAKNHHIFTWLDVVPSLVFLVVIPVERKDNVLGGDKVQDYLWQQTNPT